MNTLGTAALTTLGTAVAVVGTAILIHVGSKLVYWAKYRKRIPVVLHASPHPAGTTSTGHTAVDPTVSALVAELTEFIAEDAPGPLVPGELESTAPELNTVPFDNNTHWLATVASLALARRPGYHLHLTVHRPTGDSADANPRWITATLLDRGRGVVVASRGFRTSDPHLVSRIGCFCIFQVQAQRRVARWIPRWERWNFESSYYAYREGLRLRQAGVDTLKKADESDAADKPTEANQLRVNAKTKLRKAAEKFRVACVTDLSNVQPRLLRAAILELLDERSTAVRIYAGCRDLWPENIETTYRLIAAAQVNRQSHYRQLRLWYETQTHPGSTDQLAAIPHQRSLEAPTTPRTPATALPVLDNTITPDFVKIISQIQRQLTRWHLIRMWFRTWHPKRFNPGERRYWSSWFRPWNPGAPLTSLRIKRTEFLAAVRVVGLIIDLHNVLVRALPAELRELLGHPTGPAQADTAFTGARTDVRDLFDRLAKEVINRGEDGVGWLLHPERMATPEPPSGTLEHQPHWHESGADDRTAPLGANSPKATIGWLAHYNAVCFLSLASTLPAADRPWTCDDTQYWEHDCLTAALRELGRVMRDPYTDLDPSWLDGDDDLAPMRTAFNELASSSATNALATFYDYWGRRPTSHRPAEDNQVAASTAQ